MTCNLRHPMSLRHPASGMFPLEVECDIEQVTFICVTWLIHMRDVTHIYVGHIPYGCWMWHWVRHITFMNEAYRIYEWVMSHIWMSYVGAKYCAYASRHLISDMFHMDVECDPGQVTFICVTWLIYMCDVTHSYVLHIPYGCWMWHRVRHITLMNEAYRIHEWVMSHIWMSHVTHMNKSYHTYEWVMSHIWMSHVTHMNKSYHTYEWVMSHVWMRHVTHMS